MADPTSSQAPFSPLAEAQMTIDGSEQDKALSNSEFLTRREVLTRRSRRVKQLLRIYKILYWLLMEELRARYKEYYWEYGKSAFKEDENKNGSFNANCTDIMEVNGENGKLGSGPDEGVRKCAVAGCKTKAMALARFCHSHILSDSKQKLYKGCSYVVKSAQTGPILCGKPILKSTVPAICPTHLQIGEKHLARALKKAGLNVSSPSKVAPKLHVLAKEFVYQIQAKRRAAKKASAAKVEIKEEKAS